MRGLDNSLEEAPRVLLSVGPRKPSGAPELGPLPSWALSTLQLRLLPSGSLSDLQGSLPSCGSSGHECEWGGS